MNTGKIVNYSFIASIIIMILGALAKITHCPYSQFLLVIGLLSLAVFAITCIYEITKSEKIEGTQKFMWIIGFLFITMVTGLVYILSARKRIV